MAAEYTLRVQHTALFKILDALNTRVSISLLPKACSLKCFDMIPAYRSHPTPPLLLEVKQADTSLLALVAN